MKSDVPLKLDFPILEKSRILYFLAPRVEEDEDDSMYEEYQKKWGFETRKLLWYKLTFLKLEGIFFPLLMFSK